MAAKPTVASLHRKLQPIFNHYIRLRDTHVNEIGERVGTCISCSRELPYEQLQAGHFVPASVYYLRYAEDNVHGQCQQCNGFRRGNWTGYMVGLVDRIGMWEVFELVRSRVATRKYTVESLTEAIEYYKGLIGEME